MRSAPFGPLGVSVPVIGIGTWQMQRDDRASAVSAVRRAVELGMTHVDTAELYGEGKVEEIVRDALAGGLREQVFLTSKVKPDNASRAGTVRACEQSLRRLATDRLDLYLLHWRGRHPLAETIGGFEELRAAGKIRAWGVSNFDVDDLEEARAIAGEGAIACNQVLYHLGNRTIEHEVLPWCERHRVALVGYSPFGSPDASFPPGGREGARALEEIAAAHGVTTRAVTLAFLTRRPALFGIPKSSNPEHVAQNRAADDVVLSEGEIARIDKAFPLGAWRGLPSI
jgi:diketogulonate reductase-like aldo/keto reductase